MKKIILIFHLFIFFIVSSQKKNDYKNILQSENVAEIESFLREAHPEDPKRMIMKSKLVKLKNEAWIKAGKNLPQTISQKPVIIETSKKNSKNHDENEEEFKKLLLLDTDSAAFKQKKIKLLNQLFSQDSSTEDAIILIQNNSACNIILRIQGEEIYNLPVSSRSENSLMVKKGNYQFTSVICDSKYNASKSITKSTVITLNYSGK